MRAQHVVIGTDDADARHLAVCGQPRRLAPSVFLLARGMRLAADITGGPSIGAGLEKCVCFSYPHHETTGDGPPLLLLHNFFGSSQSWEYSFKETLAQVYRLVIPDLRGHGRSTNPAQTFTHRQAAQDLFALLDHLQIDRYQAIGVSSGAMTLLHMATQQPARSEALVLIAGTSYFPEACRVRLRESTPENVPAEGWQLLREQHPRGDEQIHALFQHFQGMAETYDDMTFTPPHLATITAPTFIIHGDRDLLFPVNIPVEMYQSIPHSYLWLVPNAIHLDPAGGYADTQMHTRNALFKEYFAQVVLDFLAGGWTTEEKAEVESS